MLVDIILASTSAKSKASEVAETVESLWGSKQKKQTHFLTLILLFPISFCSLLPSNSFFKGGQQQDDKAASQRGGFHFS